MGSDEAEREDRPSFSSFRILGPTKFGLPSLIADWLRSVPPPQYFFSSHAPLLPVLVGPPSRLHDQRSSLHRRSRHSVLRFRPEVR